MSDLITPAERAALPALTEYEQMVLDRAAHFTTHRFYGRFNRETREFATFAEAAADARGDHKAMLYAVTADDMSAHLINGDKLA